MLCENCGAENREGANFCNNCGRELSHIPADVKTPEPASPRAGEESPPREQLNNIFNGRYELKEMLGRGGMGVIYRARDQQLGMDVAIKFLRDSFAKNFVAVDSLKREARAAMHLAHPNIVRLFNFEDTADVKFILMEFVRGESLASIAARKPGKRFTEGETIGYASEICEALKYAHAENVIHRDIKPSNILVTKDGRVKVADFGVASVIETFREDVEPDVSGTPAYMSPEQVLGQPLDGRSDIYSLGVTMYEMLAGKLPVRPKEAEDQLIPMMPDPIPGVSEWMNNIVLKCLRKDPDGRWRDAQELKDVLTGKKDVGMAIKSKYPPWWLVSEEERKANSPKVSTSTPLITRMPQPTPHYKHAEVYISTLPSQTCKIIDRVEQQLEKQSSFQAKTANTAEHEQARMTLGALAGVVGGLLIIFIHRPAFWPFSDKLLIQVSWVIYGGLIGGAIGIAQRKPDKGFLSLMFGMIGGLVAATLMNWSQSLPVSEMSKASYYGIACGAAIGAFLGMADGIYEKSARYLIRCFLWEGLGGIIAGLAFSGVRYVFSSFWSPSLNWITVGVALGFFVNMGVAFAERPCAKG